MAVIGAKTTAGHPRWLQPWMLYAAGVLLLASLAWGLSLTMAASRERAGFASQAAQIATQHEAELGRAREEATLQSAESLAAGLRPLMAFSGQVPEITDRTLQSVVEELVRTRRYRFIAVADINGTVLASSDLAVIGKQLTVPHDRGTVSVAIGRSTRLGSVTITPN